MQHHHSQDDRGTPDSTNTSRIANMTATAPLVGQSSRGPATAPNPKRRKLSDGGDYATDGYWSAVEQDNRSHTFVASSSVAATLANPQMTPAHHTHLEFREVVFWTTGHLSQAAPEGPHPPLDSAPFHSDLALQLAASNFPYTALLEAMETGALSAPQQLPEMDRLDFAQGRNFPPPPPIPFPSSYSPHNNITDHLHDHFTPNQSARLFNTQSGHIPSPNSESSPSPLSGASPLASSPQAGTRVSPPSAATTPLSSSAKMAEERLHLAKVPTKIQTKESASVVYTYLPDHTALPRPAIHAVRSKATRTVSSEAMRSSGSESPMDSPHPAQQAPVAPRSAPRCHGHPRAESPSPISPQAHFNGPISPPEYPNYGAATAPVQPSFAGPAVPRQSPTNASPHSTGSAVGSERGAFPRHYTPVLADFDVIKLIGTGTFGRVHLCRHKATGQVYCLKSLQKTLVVKREQVTHTITEKEILLSLNHPGIVKLLYTFNDEDNLYMLMEYVPGGELFTVIRRYGKLPESIARIYTAEILLTLEFLHEQFIVYRDLKPENVLLDETGHLKLSDFGFSKRLGPTNRTWTLCGTPDYMAPEILTMQGHGVAVDYWALGVLIYEMLVGFPPFTADHVEVIFAKIKEPERIQIPPFVSMHAASLIRSLLVVDPSRRLGSIHRSVADIKTHPWFTGVDFVELSKRSQLGPLIPHVHYGAPGEVADELPMLDLDGVEAVMTMEIQALFADF